MFDSPDKVIEKQELFNKSDHILVGVSGGSDSMVLCHALYKSGYKFGIAHCNYQLRAEDSEKDQQFVEEWANKHEIKCHVQIIPLTVNANIQATARKLRYQFFDELKTTYNYKYILTAHNSNDKIEGLFLNLSRGAGLKGLKSLNMQNYDLIRPFINISRTVIEEYAQKNGIAFRQDISNFSDKYLRDFFRNQVIPLINSKVPGFEDMCIRSISHLQELTLYVNAEYGDWKAKNVKITGDQIQINIPLDVHSYFFSLFLSDHGFHPDTILEIRNNFGIIGKLFQSHKGTELLLDRNKVFIRKMGVQNSREYKIEHLKGELELATGILRWNEIRFDTDLTVYYNKHSAVFDLNSLLFPLTLRTWKSGDRIQPFGMNGKSRKIQDVYSDNKISRFSKDEMYILESGNQVIWLPGILRSCHAVTTSNTRNCLVMEWHEKH